VEGRGRKRRGDRYHSIVHDFPDFRNSWKSAKTGSDEVLESVVFSDGRVGPLVPRGDVLYVSWKIVCAVYFIPYFP
jgi:hypothetical protein